MALSDPRYLAVGSTAVTLPRTVSGINLSEYGAPTAVGHLTLSHTYGKRTRRLFRFDHNKVAPDPFTSGLSSKVSMSTYLVADTPVTGYNATEQRDVVIAMLDHIREFAEGTDGPLVLDRWLGGES